MVPEAFHDYFIASTGAGAASEHYFQAQKFAGTPFVDQIRQAPTPNEAAKMGRRRSLPLRPDWEEIKDQVMLRGVLRKFETHADMSDFDNFSKRSQNVG